MRRPYLLISGAWFVHAIAWFLPIIKDGAQFPHGLPGWQAFLVAACALWPYENFKFDQWYNAVLSTISAATTLLFIFGSAGVVWHGSLRLRRVSAWIATSAFIINAHWYVLFGSDRKDLGIGYFPWWLSFLLFAFGLFDLSRRKADSTSNQVPGLAEAPQRNPST
jgi:hypothetical protein